MDLDDDDRVGQGTALSSDGNRMATVSARVDDAGNYSSDSGVVFLFTFDDHSAFQNPTHVGTIGKGYTGTYSLDLDDLTSGDYIWRTALDGDGDRLVLSQLDATSGGVDSGSVFTIKFDDTNFTNPTHVGTIGHTYNSSSYDLSIGTLGSGDSFTSLSLTDDG